MLLAVWLFAAQHWYKQHAQGFRPRVCAIVVVRAAEPHRCKFDAKQGCLLLGQIYDAACSEVEKHLQANKPNCSSGRADTNMGQPENGQAPAELAADEPAADETEQEDESVAAADAIDQVVARAIMDRESLSTSEPTKAVMTYLQQLQASEYQPRSQNNAGRSKPIELFHGKPEQCGKDAKDWLSSVEIYLDFVNEKRPVVTYLRGDAQSWWTQFGKV